MTSYCSFPFLFLFLPAVIAVYQLMPEKKRPYVLLAASYLFFWLISGTLLVFLLFTTVSIYSIGKRLDREGEKRCSVKDCAQRREKGHTPAVPEKSAAMAGSGYISAAGDSPDHQIQWLFCGEYESAAEMAANRTADQSAPVCHAHRYFFLHTAGIFLSDRCVSRCDEG